MELGRRGGPGGTRRGVAYRVIGRADRPTGTRLGRRSPNAVHIDLGAMLGEARGIVRHCADPGPLVTTWLAEEQRAEAMRTRQEGLIEPLTDRELTILRLLPAPSTLRELASASFVAPNTLKTHLRAIYRKLGVESRQEAVIRAHDRGLI